MHFPVWRATCAAVALLAIGSLTGSCVSSTSARAAVKPEKDRKPAPEFSLKDADGRTVKLSDYRGKVVLLNFWATWCGPCKIEIPWFTDFEQKFKDRGFAVLGVSMDEDGWDTVKPYIEDRKVNYRVVMGSDEVADIYGGVTSLPTTFLVDRQGKIAGIHVGLVSKSVYQNEIEQLLQKRSEVESKAPGGNAAPQPAGGAR
ncbi:MAG TPA: TlpA disulfide reductase family protein [Bryobacteraceae bacterium]|nr:TlpA disulfide reductase family protein [Bryobacteraceae bacterium]